MTAAPVSIQQLLRARDRLLIELHSGLDTSEREFLLSLVRAAPDWQRLDVPGIDNLPALRWKLQNLRHLKVSNIAKFEEQSAALERLLSGE